MLLTIKRKEINSLLNTKIVPAKVQNSNNNKLCCVYCMQCEASAENMFKRAHLESQRANY